MNHSLKENQVCVLIDGDNVNPKYINEIFEAATSLGRVLLAGLFLDFTSDNGKKWSNYEAAYGLKCFQHYSKPNQNSTDIIMMDQGRDWCDLYPQLTHFIIVSGDKDFHILVRTLKLKGKFVLGISTNKNATSKNFQHCCDEFLFIPLPNKVNNDTEKTDNIETLTKRKKQKFRKYIRDCLEYYNTIFIDISQIGPYLKQRDPSCDKRNYGFDKLYKFLEALGCNIEKKNGAVFCSID